jgi:carboxymethylenebutenolidase
VRTTTEHIDIPAPDGTADAVLSRPAGGTGPGVLLYMDAFGLRPRIEEMTARIAAEGYVVLAQNVFYRSRRSPLVDPDDLADPEGRSRVFEVLRPFMKELTPERAVRDAAAYLGFLQQEAAPGPVGVTGYCMGGGLALRTAGHYPERVAAAASFHGGNVATDADYRRHLLADRIKGVVYVGPADNDRSMPPEQMERLEAAMQEAGVAFRAELYEGAAHGFTMADTAAFDEAATERHWQRLFALLARALTQL